MRDELQRVYLNTDLPKGHTNHPGEKHQERSGITRTQRRTPRSPLQPHSFARDRARLQGSDDVGKAGVAPQNCAWMGSQEPECRTLSGLSC